MTRTLGDAEGPRESDQLPLLEHGHGARGYASVSSTYDVLRTQSTADLDAASPDGELDLAELTLQDDARKIRRQGRRRVVGVGFVVILSVLLLAHACYHGVTVAENLTLATVLMDMLLMLLGLPPDTVLLFSVVFLYFAGCVDRNSAVEGFGNEGVMAIGALLSLSKAVHDTGALGSVMRSVLGSPTSAIGALCRMLPPVLFVSAFLNNTPVVAMLIPEMRGWSERIGVSVKKLLIPLSFASLLGGMLTLVGSSINIIAAAAARKAPGGPADIPMFSLLPIGAVQAAVASVYIVLAERLLPGGDGEATDGGESRGTESRPGTVPGTPQAEPITPPVASPQAPRPDRRSYIVGFHLPEGSLLAGGTVGATGLLRVAGVLRVTGVRRGCEGEQLSPAPDGWASVVLREHDTVVIDALADGIVNVRRIRGLSICQSSKLPAAVVADWPRRRHRVLAEVVMGDQCAWLRGGKYEGAAPLAIANDAPMRRGECVIVECFPSFVSAYSSRNRHFKLIAPVPDSKPPRVGKTMDSVRQKVSLITIGVMMCVVAMNKWPLLYIALAALAVLISAQCLTVREAWSAVDGRMLATVAAAFGVSNAMMESGAAPLCGEAISAVAAAVGGGRAVVMTLVYTTTALLSAVMGPNSVVLIMVPIAIAAKRRIDCEANALSYILLIMYAGGASFCTPIAYQTNLMVWKAGGYAFGDFARFGAGLQVLCAAVAVAGCWYGADHPYFLLSVPHERECGEAE